MLSNGALIDRYTVDSVIGTGGTAVVYRVKHSKLGTAHALKVLSVTSRSIRERMLREGRVQATLDHLNIVTVTDVLEVDGQPGLLMEYIEGPSLEKALEDYRLDLPTAEILFLGILAGVRVAHEHGLVHRDLKPANVLLAESPQGFVPKVTDFGLAKVIADEAAAGAGQTRQGVAMGTPAYMAPEQIRDARSVDVRADIWSLGCILYELCTGVRTFPGDDTLAIYNAVVGGDIVPPREYNRSLDDRYEMAIRGCLAIDRNERIPDCDTLFAVLKGEQTWDAPELQGTVSEPTVEMTGVHDAPNLPIAARGPQGETPVAPPPRARGPRGSRPTSGGAIAAAQTVVNDGGDPLFGPLPGESRSGEAPRVHNPALGTLTDDESEEIITRPRRGPVFYAAWGAALLFLLFWVGVGGVFYFVIGPAARQTAEYESAADLTADVVRPVPSPAEAPEPEPVEEPEPIAEMDEPEPEPVAVQPRPRPTPRPRAVPSPVSPAPAPAPAGPTPVTYKLFSVPTTAFITLDGKPNRRTPLKGEVMPGLHQVRLEVDGKVEDFSINVTDGGENKWCFVFETGQLHTGNCP
ncbi:MAG: serine/threonine protein kinase [Deltaproteobacteria bacterium]|nr:MAG: serine/threonine protein kinase [Deltaproteobacteria bacterium]